MPNSVTGGTERPPVYVPLIEHPEYKFYVGAFALVALLAIAAAMFYAIFLSPVENPGVDPEARRRLNERLIAQHSAPPPPKKTQSEKLNDLREFLDKTDTHSGSFLYSATGRGGNKGAKRRALSRRKPKTD